MSWNISIILWNIVNTLFPNYVWVRVMSYCFRDVCKQNSEFTRWSKLFKWVYKPMKYKYFIYCNVVNASNSYATSKRIIIHSLKFIIDILLTVCKLNLLKLKQGLETKWAVKYNAKGKNCTYKLKKYSNGKSAMSNLELRKTYQKIFTDIKVMFYTHINFVSQLLWYSRCQTLGTKYISCKWFL